LWWLDQEPWVDSEGEDVVEVVDDAGDEGQAADDDEERPEQLPAGMLCEWDVMKSVGWCPQVEAWKL